MQLSTSVRRMGIFLTLLFALLATSGNSAPAQSSLDGLVAGRRYIVAFPDTTTNTFDARYPNVRFGDRAMLHLYAAVATTVRVTGPSGYDRSFDLTPGKFTTVDFSADSSRLPMPMVTESGTVSKKTIRIEATNPILVTCFLLTRFGTEAWTPIPVDFWGTEYYAAALPGEVANNVSPGGEFDYNKKPKMAPAEILVIASEDDTKISISPNGPLHTFPRIVNVTLNAGEAYQVQSLVDTSVFADQQADLGGSYVFATRPIAVISGNTRAQVVYSQEGLGQNSFKNMLIEWLAPITMHGTRFVYTPTWDAHRMGGPGEDIASKRKYEGIRIYGTSPGLTEGSVHGDTGFTVSKGKFIPVLFEDAAARYITTDQPAQVMMNSTAVIKYNGTTQGFGGYIGTQYDAWGAYMTELVPVERWTPFAPYFVSSEPSGMEHFINVVTDSAHINDVFMENGQRFLFNRGPIAGSPYVWGTMAVTPGRDHWLEGSNGARFSGHVYGLYKGHEEYRPGGNRRKEDPDQGARQGGSGDESVLHPSEYEEYLAVAYGYPLASTGRALPPPPTGDSIEITTTTSCPDMTIRARVVNVNPAGIAGFELQSAVNVRIKSIDTVPGRPNEWVVVLTPVDPSRDASASGLIRDRTGKSWRVAYNYVAERVVVQPAGEINFGERTNEDEATREILITNPMSTPVEVRDVRFARGNQDFSVMETNPAAPAVLPAGGQMFVTVLFSTSTAPTRTLVDTLLVSLGCYDQRVVVQAHVQSTLGVGTSGGTLGNMLHRNDPNPATGLTAIRFTLGRGADTRLDLYAVTGKKVATLVDGYRAAGDHVATLDAGALEPGVYYYRLIAGDWSATESMVVR